MKGYVKRTKESTAIAPNAPNWNNSSNKINNVSLDCNLKYKINKYSWVHTDINKWLNELISGGEETNLLWRKFPNNLCSRYSAPKEREHSPDPLSVSCTFQLPSKEHCEESRKKKTLQRRNLTNTPQTGDQGQRPQWQVTQTAWTLDPMWWKWRSTSMVVFLRTHHLRLILRRNPNRGMCYKHRTRSLKMVEVVKNKESLRSYYSQEDY